jgi:hypothetical protein
MDGNFGTMRSNFCQPKGSLMSAPELSQREMRLLVQSLEHCLATCHNEKKGSDGVCADCEAAKALKKKLDDALGG